MTLFKCKICGLKGTRKTIRKHIIKDHKIKCEKRFHNTKQQYKSPVTAEMIRL